MAGRRCRRWPAPSRRGRWARRREPPQTTARTGRRGRSSYCAPLRLGRRSAATHLETSHSIRHGVEMDLYQRLGIKRGASDEEVKKAYRSLAKQLHPDRNKDNPNAAKRFGEITQAYDLLSDKDKRARYDRGEIDEDGNPKMPFGSGFGGYSSGGGAGSRPGGAGGFEGFPGGFEAGGTGDLSDLFEGLFGAAAARGRRPGNAGNAGAGGFRQRA